SPARLALDADRVRRALRDGPQALSGDDRLRLLSSRFALAMLRTEIAAHRGHPGWRLALEAALPVDAAPAGRRSAEPALAGSL
ncbi:MAG: hypothetical protein ACXWIG_13655, partial [Caldimonas sp.]